MIKLSKRPTCYLYKTISFLWIKDGGNFGLFFTISKSVVGVVKVKKIKGDYYLSRNEKTGEYENPLKPIEYDFYRALQIYHSSALPKTVEARELIDQFMSDWVGPKEPIKFDIKPETPVNNPDKPKRPDLTVKSPEFASLTLIQIASELGIDPAKARQAARSKLTKPSEGWKWSNRGEIEKVKAVLKGL
jgi:hypothetical protein